MNKWILTVAAMAAMAANADARVEFRDCPKCDKRIRIDLAAGKAYVNLSRLEGASRDEVAARAARLLDAAHIDTPTSHHGIERPERKKSFASRPARREQSSAMAASAPKSSSARPPRARCARSTSTATRASP